LASFLLVFASSMLEAQSRGMSESRGSGSRGFEARGVVRSTPNFVGTDQRPVMPPRGVNIGPSLPPLGVDSTARLVTNGQFGGAQFRGPQFRVFVGHGAEHNRRFRSNGVVVPVYGYGYGAYPFYPQDYIDSPAGYSQAPAPAAVAPVVYEQSAVGQELEGLREEVRLLREEESLRADQARRVREPAPVAEKSEPGPTTVLVFRDGHQELHHNYAIVGKTLWIFNEHGDKKVAIADLDVPATEKANAERDVEFRLPASSR